MRVFSFLLVGLLLGWAGELQAQSGTEKLKRPLDVPASGSGNTENEEEDPETITFYGAEFEGDGFFWCLDKSCSMGYAPDMPTLIQECTASIRMLSNRAEFGVVAFSTNVIKWSPSPKRANLSNRSAATSWVQTLNPDGVTCLAAGAVAALGVANQSNKRKRQILLLGDGEPVCSGGESNTATDIASANYQQIPINCFYIGSGAGGISLFQQIANASGGTFIVIN